MIVRRYRKLAKKRKNPVFTAEYPDTNLIVNRHGRLFSEPRPRNIIVFNCTSLFSVFLYGAGNGDSNLFFNNFTSNLRDLLHDADNGKSTLSRAME